MIIVLLVIGVAAAQRGHYIVDYQRLPLYQEFYLSPGLYRPLFPPKQESGVQEARKVDVRSNEQSQQVSAKHLHHKHQQQQHYQQQYQQQQQLQQPVEQAQQPVAQQLVQEQPVLAVAHDQPAVTAQDQAVVVSAQDQAVVVHQPAVVVNAEQPSALAPPMLKYSNSMTPDGSYSYKYETADGLTREETSVMEAAEDGRMVASVKGSYSYPGPDGRTITVNYIADEGGFRASGNHLPQSLQDTVYDFKYIVPSS